MCLCNIPFPHPHCSHPHTVLHVEMHCDDEWGGQLTSRFWKNFDHAVIFDYFWVRVQSHRHSWWQSCSYSISRELFDLLKCGCDPFWWKLVLLFCSLKEAGCICKPYSKFWTVYLLSFQLKLFLVLIWLHLFTNWGRIRKKNIFTVWCKIRAEFIYL